MNYYHSQLKIPFCQHPFPFHTLETLKRNKNTQVCEKLKNKKKIKKKNKKDFTSSKMGANHFCFLVLFSTEIINSHFESFYHSLHGNKQR